MDILELFLREFVNLAMLLFEYIGVGVITFAGIQGISGPSEGLWASITTGISRFRAAAPARILSHGAFI